MDSLTLMPNQIFLEMWLVRDSRIGPGYGFRLDPITFFSPPDVCLSFTLQMLNPFLKPWTAKVDLRPQLFLFSSYLAFMDRKLRLSLDYSHPPSFFFIFPFDAFRVERAVGIEVETVRELPLISPFFLHLRPVPSQLVCFLVLSSCHLSKNQPSTCFSSPYCNS